MLCQLCFSWVRDDLKELIWKRGVGFCCEVSVGERAERFQQREMCERARVLFGSESPDLKVGA